MFYHHLSNWTICFILGIADSCALQRLFPSFVVSIKIRQDFIKSTCLNGVIFFASAIFLEYYFPLLVQIVLPPSEDKSISYLDEYVHIFINRSMLFLWAYPIYCVSTILGIIWNHAMIVETYTLYYGRSVPHKSFTQVIQSLAEDIYNLLCMAVYFIEMALISYIPYLGTTLLVCHLAWFYSLIAFDYKWRFDGISLVHRFSIVEASWSYMLGFGFIPAIIAAFLPKFINLSLLAFITPLHGMLGVVATVPETREHSLPVFKLLRTCNIHLVKFIILLYRVFACCCGTRRTKT